MTERNLHHNAEDLRGYSSILDQLPLRRAAVVDALGQSRHRVEELDAVVGRGGLLYPLPGGTYRVDPQMVEDLRTGVQGTHASNLGGILAAEIAEHAGGKPAYIVDPVVVDELAPEARLSGIPELPRTSIFHALNQKAMARRAARELNRRYEEVNVVVAHLGGGITVGAHKNGRVIDVNDGLNGEGPFTPERSGGIAALKLVDLCFSGRYEHPALRKMIKGRGGLTAYLGTNDGREIVKRIEEGDEQARAVYRALAWQISREIGAAAAILAVPPDAVVITGGLARDALITRWITEFVRWMAPVLVYPGEEEMAALAAGVLRVLRGEEDALLYDREWHRGNRG